MKPRITAKDSRHSLTVGVDRAPGRKLILLSSVMSPRLGSADVGADVATARRLTKKPALDKRFEKRAARLGFEVPQALCLTLGERQAGHLEILASNPLHDRFDGMSLHALTAST